MSKPQGGILAPVPSLSRYLEFSLTPDSDPGDALSGLGALYIDGETVFGFGPGLVRGLGATVPPLRTFPAISGPGCEVPSTQADVLCWIRGDDRGVITHMGRTVAQTLSPAFHCTRLVDGFCYGNSQDLTGYEDGTENPEGDEAVAAAVATGLGPGLDGSSFVAIQQWVHDLDHFESLSEEERDNVFGRHIADNEEFDEAPESAHVKRTAQESFSPEAFMVRRSMPWSDADGEGLMFVSFGKSFDAFEAVLNRMAGMEDGIVDALFRFSRPVSGSYFWCPPLAGKRLDLSAVGF